jgi:preprotein translocase subunit SecG
MIILLTIVHVLICLFLVIVVLLQSGKAADLAGAFGGMGSQTAFGPRGSATVLSKATTIAAGLFMVTSLTLAIMSTRSSGTGKSIVETQGSQAQQPPAQTAPAPAPVPAAPPAGAQPGAVPAPGQPSVTLSNPDTGESKTIPLNIPPQPPAGGSAPKPVPVQRTPAPAK